MLRYRLDIRGFENFDTKNPVIVFPNHPALVDPMLLVSLVAKKKILSPLMTETYFHTPGLGPIVRALHTIPVGDLSRGGSIEDVEKAFHGIDLALKNKQNILLYTSGHIYVQPFEHIVGKKMAYETVGRLPSEVRIILTRTKGLWGSMWSKAYTGDSPKLTKVLMLSLWHIVANLFFFSPRRDVSIEFVDMTDELKSWHKLGLDIFNQKLQDYYNTGGNEECRFIPHYFYHNDIKDKKEPQNIVGSVAEVSKGNGILETDIPRELLDMIIAKVAKIKKINPKSLTFQTNLVLDLRADSLDMA